MCENLMTTNGSGLTGRPRLIVRMSLRQAIPGELLSSIARFRFAHRSHPKPKPPVRLLKISERLPSQNSTVSRLGFIPAQGPLKKSSAISAEG
jgi:hypothetical protein